MGIYASPEDIANRWSGYDETTHSDLAVTLIGDAEALILDRIPYLATRIANGVVSERTVTAVVADMVTRVLRNPEGFREETDGDYSYARPAASAGTGRVELTGHDLSRLNGPRRGATTGPGDDGALRNLVRSPGGQLVQDWRFS